MGIIINRETGWQGGGSKIQIKLNGKIVAAIHEKEMINLEVPENIVRVQVRQFGISSNEIEVVDGAKLEIRSTKLMKVSFPLMLLINFLTNFIPDLHFRTITFLILNGLLILSLFLFNGFYLKDSKEVV